MQKEQLNLYKNLCRSALEYKKGNKHQDIFLDEFSNYIYIHLLNDINTQTNNIYKKLEKVYYNV